MYCILDEKAKNFLLRRFNKANPIVNMYVGDCCDPSKDQKNYAQAPNHKAMNQSVTFTSLWVTKVKSAHSQSSMPVELKTVHTLFYLVIFAQIVVYVISFSLY